MERAELERLDRDTLIARAEEMGVVRANVLTRPELVDEILLRHADRQVVADEGEEPTGSKAASFAAATNAESPARGRGTGDP